MSTILDVEAKSGVSRSTISRYLNKKKVTDENRIKIERAIKELSYHRNPMASGLKSSKTYTVGVVLPEIIDPYFPRMIKDFQRHMHENRYQTILNSYGNDPALEIEQVKTLANKRVDGLVVASINKKGDHIKECLDNGLPVILLDRLIEGLECDSVTVDNYQAVYDAISLGIRKGHRKIGFVGGSEYYTDIVRLQGLRGALKNVGIGMRDEYVSYANLIEHDSTRQFMRLMNLNDPPTLIFCSNVYHALGAFEAMLQYKLNIPQDVSIITFDRLSSSPYYGFVQCVKPEFASICQPHEEISLRTAKILLKRIQGGMDNYEPIRVELKTRFFMTDSVADINETKL